MEDKEQIESKLLTYIDDLVKVRQISDYKNHWKYQQLETKIPEYIWRYANVLFPNGIKMPEKDLVCYVEDSSVEICEFAKYFVRSFVPDKSKGNGLGYIYNILRQKITHTGSNNDKFEKRHGIRISDNKTDDLSDKQYKELVIICKKNGKKICDDGVVEFLADQTGKNANKIKEIIKSHSISVIGETVTNSDGEECSLFDLMVGGDIYKEYDYDRENLYIAGFDRMEKCFAQYHEKKKAYVSAIVTFNLIKDFNLNKESTAYIVDLLSKYSFADKDMLDLWQAEKNLGFQKDITHRFKPHLSEEDAKSDGSRELKNFVKKLSISSQKCKLQ